MLDMNDSMHVVRHYNKRVYHDMREMHRDLPPTILGTLTDF
jgi:hypothetical protein